MQEQQPGQTITPQSQEERANKLSPAHVAPIPDDSNSQPSTEINQLPSSDTATTAVRQMSAANTANGPKRSEEGSISWTAAEFIEHSKTAGWYFSLAGAAIVLAGLIFIVTHDKISTAVILVAALALGIFAARKPRTLSYRLDDAGLSIGTKFYAYEQFKSFSIVDEGAVPSIYLLPLRRFMPALTLYYVPADEEKIVDMLTPRLPLEERRIDSVDRFMHRIRF